MTNAQEHSPWFLARLMGPEVKLRGVLSEGEFAVGQDLSLEGDTVISLLIRVCAVGPVCLPNKQRSQGAGPVP